LFKKLFVSVFPWFIKRILLNKLFGYEIHPSAKIGFFAWIFPKKLIMKEGAKIAHFSVAVNLDKIEIGANTSISRGNWITGYPSKTNSKHFLHQPERKSELIIGHSSAITKNHHIDCTNTITIGNFVTIAGYQSQLLTHSINVIENRQDSEPIVIGNYTFISTNVVILGGAVLPSYSVLAAKSLLNKSYSEEWTLYGGVPAKPIKPISKDAKYFNRTTGFVY
jgi:acetyltransferase-like isoleucine patch superfamily enzyme